MHSQHNQVLTYQTIQIRGRLSRGKQLIPAQANVTFSEDSNQWDSLNRGDLTNTEIPSQLIQTPQNESGQPQYSHQQLVNSQISLYNIMKTILKDRVLWADGHIEFNADQLADFILNGGEITDKIHVNALSEDIIKFKEFNPYLVLNVKRDLEHLNKTWNIPDSFKSMSIQKFISDKFQAEMERKETLGKPFSDEQVNERIDRIKMELDLYKKNDMSIILKTIIYIVDVFRKNGVIWGTGRGSSCASYVLYLIGLHSVDSVELDVDINEFFKDKVEL